MPGIPCLVYLLFVAINRSTINNHEGDMVDNHTVTLSIIVSIVNNTIKLFKQAYMSHGWRRRNDMTKAQTSPGIVRVRVTSMRSRSSVSTFSDAIGCRSLFSLPALPRQHRMLSEPLRTVPQRTHHQPAHVHGCRHSP